MALRGLQLCDTAAACKDNTTTGYTWCDTATHECVAPHALSLGASCAADSDYSSTSCNSTSKVCQKCALPGFECFTSEDCCKHARCSSDNFNGSHPGLCVQE